MPKGRPPLYETPEQMQDIIESYFVSVTYIHPDTGQEITRPTMAGLARHLGMDRRSLVNYANKNDFFPTIKEARARVEEALENRLFDPSPTGVIFNLKNNFGWKDVQDRNISGDLTVTKVERTLVDPQHSDS